MCDYATRYPEAAALHSIDAEHIADEILTSKLLSELYKMLHIHQLQTSPYHPQTDRLMERFNQTLKFMLKKVTTSEGKDWDKMFSYLLFVYWEVPQASTGFPSFERLYGRAVNGPLDALKSTWEAGGPGEDSVVSHILSICDKLAIMTELVKNNLSNAQERQCKWYDRNARTREFKPGQQVLVLLPTSSSKLLAQWQGPCEKLNAWEKSITLWRCMIAGKGNGCSMSICYVSGIPHQAVLYIVQKYWMGNRTYLPEQRVVKHSQKVNQFLEIISPNCNRRT